MRRVALHELLVLRRGEPPVLALKRHVRDGELGERGVLRVGEVVAHVLEEARRLDRVLILLLLHALLVGLGGVARLRAGDGLRDVDARVLAARAGAQREEDQSSSCRRSHLCLPNRAPAPSPPRTAGVPSRPAPGNGAASPASRRASGPAGAAPARARPALPRSRPPPLPARRPGLRPPRSPAMRASSRPGAEHLPAPPAFSPACAPSRRR